VFTSLGSHVQIRRIDRQGGRYGLLRETSTPPSRWRSAATPRRSLRARQRPHFPIIVRLARSIARAPGDPELADWRCGRNGTITQIPLSEVASINVSRGRLYLSGAAGRYLPIKFSVRDRDLGSAIRKRRNKVAEQVQLPPGSRWSGRRVGNLQDAIKRLSICADQPRADRGTAVVQFRLDGRHAARHERDSDGDLRRVLGLLISGIPFSVSAASASSRCSASRYGRIIILSQYNQLIDEGSTGQAVSAPASCSAAVLMTCSSRGRAVAAACRGIGSQVQKPAGVWCHRHAAGAAGDPGDPAV